jgi:hypothetical protein
VWPAEEKTEEAAMKRLSTPLCLHPRGDDESPKREQFTFPSLSIGGAVTCGSGDGAGIARLARHILSLPFGPAVAELGEGSMQRGISFEAVGRLRVGRHNLLSVSSTSAQHQRPAGSDALQPGFRLPIF